MPLCDKPAKLEENLQAKISCLETTSEMRNSPTLIRFGDNARNVATHFMMRLLRNITLLHALRDQDIQL